MENNLCNFLHHIFFGWLVCHPTGCGSWVPLDFFLFGDPHSDLGREKFPDQVAEVKTGDKEISIQIAQVHTSGPRAWRVQSLRFGGFWVSEGSTLGNTVFVTCRIIDSTNKMAIIPSRQNDQNIPPRSFSKVPDLVGVKCDHSLEGTPNGAMIFNLASHLLVLANGTHATTTGCVQKFQHQRFKRPGGLLVEADSKGPKTKPT